jgi:hypothetical protein
LYEGRLRLDGQVQHCCTGYSCQCILKALPCMAVFFETGWLVLIQAPPLFLPDSSLGCQVNRRDIKYMPVVAFASAP